MILYFLMVFSCGDSDDTAGDTAEETETETFIRYH